MTVDGTILIVEDEANMRRVLGALLRRHGYAVVDCANGVAALEILEDRPVDAVLSDLRMPQMNGLDLLGEVQRRHQTVPFILLTAHGTIGSAVEALKQGAFDYLTKPFEPDEVAQIVAKAVKTHRLQETETRVAPHEDPGRLLVGPSGALSDVKRMIERVASTTVTVLITGETGTGKELVAQSIHRQSARSGGPLVKINCAAIPEPLLESELFGHEKGAFTGATRQKPGRFELADEGTLFLDEVGELPMTAQPKLLRVLQEGRFYRVGGTHTIEVDVRLVAATNRDLRAEMQAGRFREDLYYRLQVVPIRLPPLRERAEDIPSLARLFVERVARRLGRPVATIETDAMDALCGHSWPGNIRELENAVERAVVLSDGTGIRLHDLPRDLQGPTRGANGSPGDRTASLKDRVRSATRRIEREAILEALHLTCGNVTQAARQLGLSRRGLQLKMRELEIERDA